jgi:hypothetical protein
MPALTRFFFTPVHDPRNAWSVVNWWESRRAAFNITVGSAGMISLGALSLFAHLPPHPAHLVIPWGGVLAYALLANICYTLGAVADIAIRRRWGDAYETVGPTFFRYGFVFAVGITLLPVPLAAMSWIVRILQVLR